MSHWVGGTVAQLLPQANYFVTLRLAVPVVADLHKISVLILLLIFFLFLICRHANASGVSCGVATSRTTRDSHVPHPPTNTILCQQQICNTFPD